MAEEAPDARVGSLGAEAVAVTEVTCADEQYQPTRAQMTTLPWVGATFVPERFRRYDNDPVNGEIMMNRMVFGQPKAYRRIARKLLHKQGRTGRMDRQIEAARVEFPVKTNSHAKKRLLKKEREYQRERRAEEQRLAEKIRLERRLEAAMSKPPASDASTTSPSPSLSDSTTCVPSETPSSVSPGRDE